MKISSLLLACVCLVLLAATTVREACGSVFLNETFDYASQADLFAAWPASGGDNATYTLDTTLGNPLPSYDMPSPPANFAGFTGAERRLVRNIGVVNGSDANPLHLSFDLLLEDTGASSFWRGARDFVELRGYANGSFGDGSLNNVVAAGVYNATSDTFNTSYYQGRVLSGSDWNTLDEGGAPQRSTGWHNLDITITSSHILFSVDGVLAETELRPNSDPFDSVVLGSGLTSGPPSNPPHTAWVDNVKVYDSPSDSGTVPEPLSVLVWGGLACAALTVSYRHTFSRS